MDATEFCGGYPSGFGIICIVFFRTRVGNSDVSKGVFKRYPPIDSMQPGQLRTYETHLASGDWPRSLSASYNPAGPSRIDFSPDLTRSESSACLLMAL